MYSVDSGTSYYKTVATDSRLEDAMVTDLGTMWILRHGAPKTFASDA